MKANNFDICKEAWALWGAYLAAETQAEKDAAMDAYDKHRAECGDKKCAAMRAMHKAPAVEVAA